MQLNKPQFGSLIHKMTGGHFGGALEVLIKRQLLLFGTKYLVK